MNTLVLMAGTSFDFEEKGYKYPKYLIELHRKPLISSIIESLEKVTDNITFIIRKHDQEHYYLKDVLRIMSKGSNIIEINDVTRGAVCTALYAVEKIDNNEELLIVNGDQLIKADLKPAIENFRNRNLDGGIVTMNAINPKYSSVLLDENGFVIQTSEKRPISDIASTGVSYYKHGCDFLSSAFSVIEKDANTQGNYYISSTFNEMILKQKLIGIYQIDANDYISFATYQMYENYMSHIRKK